MKISFALCLTLLFFESAFADGEKSPDYYVENPKFQSPFARRHGHSCDVAVAEGNETCILFAQEQGAALSAVVRSEETSLALVDSTLLGRNIAGLGASASQRLNQNCAAAETSCFKACDQAAMQIRERTDFVRAAEEHQYEYPVLTGGDTVPDLRHDYHEARGAQHQCKEIFGRYADLSSEVGIAATKQRLASEVTRQAASGRQEPAEQAGPPAPATVAGTEPVGGKTPEPKPGGAAEPQNQPKLDSEDPVRGKTDNREGKPSENKGFNPWMAAGLGAAGGYMLRKENVDSKPDAASSSGASSSSGSSSGASSGTSSGASSGSSSGSNTASSSGGSSGSATVAAALDPDCAKTDAYTKSKCDEVTAKACAFSLTTPSCSAVADRYCGFVTTAAATTANGTAAGQDSQFCKDSLAQRFCSKGGRESCLGCRQLKDRMSPTCKANPTAAVCNPVLSTAVLAQFRAACGDDPIWTDPNYANTPSAVANTSNVAVNTVAPNTLSMSSVVTNRTYSATDVSVSTSANVVTTSSATIQAQCQAGLLNNCGPRSF